MWLFRLLVPLLGRKKSLPDRTACPGLSAAGRRKLRPLRGGGRPAQGSPPPPPAEARGSPSPAPRQPAPPPRPAPPARRPRSGPTNSIWAVFQSCGLRATPGFAAARAAGPHLTSRGAARCPRSRGASSACAGLHAFLIRAPRQHLLGGGAPRRPFPGRGVTAGAWPQVPVLGGPCTSPEKLDEMRASRVAVFDDRNYTF